MLMDMILSIKLKTDLATWPWIIFYFRIWRRSSCKHHSLQSHSDFYKRSKDLFHDQQRPLLKFQNK